MTKITLVFLALALGAVTRFKCLKRPGTDRSTALLVSLVRIEAVVMILILSLSGTLANTPAAMTEAAGYSAQKLLLSQGDRWVERCRAPCGYPRSNRGDDEKDRSHG